MSARTYANPVHPGFFPDPSAIRVGEDFYMVNSTFQYFPAIAISHSRDLVRWELIGHAVTRSEYLDLSELADSHGIWAPDISYSEGWYYVFATLRLNNPGEGPRPEGMSERPLRRQLVMRSRKPEGLYSEPWIIDVDSIDPSHFVDADGSHYMVISPGVNIVPLSPDCSRALGESECVWPGTGEKAPEGPHIFRKDGWYYAMLAEGGTGYGHRITCARSRSLRGPYEPSPHNPLLMQTDPSSPIQRTGHGKLVQTSRGDWWILYLCGRPNGGEYTTLGRETALEPVRWTEDGWFVINEGRGPSLRNQAPDLPEDRPAAGDGRLAPWRDDFDSSLLSPDWEFVRNPDPSSWSLAERPGFYRIWTQDPGPDSIGAKNILLRRETAHSYEARSSLEFEPSAEGEEAGLICYYGIRNHVKLSVVLAPGGARALRLAENRNGVVTILGELRDIPSGPVCLSVRVEGQRRSFYVAQCAMDGAIAGERLVGVVEDASFLSDEGVLVGKHHTGTLVGMFAHADGSGRRIAADFDYFEYRDARS